MRVLQNFYCKVLCTGFAVLTLLAPVYALDPALPPGKNFDLSAFKLQTMSVANLAFLEVKAESLTSGHTNKFFHTDAADGSMVFMTPADGGTTSGSSYPRTELRQTGFFANWKLADTTTYSMKAVCKVTRSPNTVVIGQVHGSNDNSEMVELEWINEGGGTYKVSAMFQTNNSAGSNYFVTLASGLSLGSQVTYEFKMKQGVLDVTVNGKTGTQTYTTQYYGTSDGYYFKAGNYLQGSGSSTSYSEVKFYSLQIFRSGNGPAVNTRRNEPGSHARLSLVSGPAYNGCVFNVQGRIIGRSASSPHTFAASSAGFSIPGTAGGMRPVIAIK